MKKRGKIYLLLFALLFIGSGITAYQFYQSHYFEEFISWTRQNLILYTIIVITFKVIAMVYPPLPGSVITVGSIPVFGWFGAYLTDFAGGLIGASISYFIAKKYGRKIVESLITDETLKKLEQTKVKHKREIEAVIVMRILGGASIVEVVNYGAPLVNISFKSFIAGYFISHPITTLPIFYFANSFFAGNNTIFTIGIAIISLLVLYKIKGRYFE